MLYEELEILFKEFQKELTIAAQHVLIKKGVDRNSKLVKTMEYEYKDDMFVLIANDYYQYVSTGRKKNVRKVPVQDLIKWIKDKRIPIRGSINSTAFAIQTAIYKNGIKAKKFQDPVVDVTSDMVAEYSAEELSELIVNELVDALEQNN